MLSTLTCHEPFHPFSSLHVRASGRRSKVALPGVAEAQRIARMTDPVRRNLRITDCYHRLTLGLRELVDHRNVGWTAYATWASNTAGRYIRGELSLLSFARPIRARVSAWVAEGNRLVFEDMGPFFAGLLQCLSRGAPTTEDLDELRASLRPGPVDQGGQDLLIEALDLYVRAASEPCAKSRAEQIFLANLLVGHHEQTRLQEVLVGALGAPWSALGELFPVPALGSRRLTSAFESWFERLQQATRQFFTRAFMKLELPETRVVLGRDMPPISPAGDFPQDLMQLRNPRLLRLLARLDRTPNTVVGSAADDWTSLDDRMNFVVDFFRSRQQDERLFRSPLTLAERALVSVT